MYSVCLSGDIFIVALAPRCAPPLLMARSKCIDRCWCVCARAKPRFFGRRRHCRCHIAVNTRNGVCGSAAAINYENESNTLYCQFQRAHRPMWDGGLMIFSTQCQHTHTLTSCLFACMSFGDVTLPLINRERARANRGCLIH